MYPQPSEERMERALGVARAARTADIRRDLGGALLLYRDAQDLLEEMEPSPLLANILRWQGSVHRDRGEPEQAAELYRRSFAAGEACGSAAAQAAALNCLAVGAQARDDLQEARRLYRSAAKLAVEAGEHRLTGLIEQNLGLLCTLLGDLAEAERRYESSLKAFESASDGASTTSVLTSLGTVLNDIGAPSRAEVAFRRGLDEARARGDRRMEEVLLTHCAESFIALRRWDEATEALDSAFTIAMEGEEPIRVAEVLRLRGVLERERGRRTQARQRLDEALTLATRMRDRLLMGEVLVERAEVHLQKGDDDSAAEDLEHALAAFVAGGAIPTADRLRRRLSNLRAAAE